MNEQAVVVALEESSVWVETQRSTTCNACSVQKGCGQGLMTKMLPGKEHYLRVLVSPAELSRLGVGDQIEISVPDDVVLKASLVVYLVPLFGLLAGVIAGNTLVPGDPGAISGGVLGLLAGLAIVRFHAHIIKDDTRVQPGLVRVVASQTDSLHARVV